MNEVGTIPYSLIIGVGVFVVVLIILLRRR